MGESVDVAVVGAGLAGLTAAFELSRAGREVVVLEAGDAVGGRVRTDVVDGYRLDRGFQVLLTGYPAVQRLFDLDALQLRAFSPGVRIRYRGGFHRLADPFRAPVSGLGAAFTPVASVSDGLRLLRWRRSLLAGQGRHLTTRDAVATSELLRSWGFSSDLVEAFFRPFLAGVFFDPELATSSRITELVFRAFFRGQVAVPAHGMQALPEQLAARLPPGVVRLDAAVTGLETSAGGVSLGVADGEAVRAREVVVATAAPAAGALLGDRLDRLPDGRGTTTLYFRASHSPVNAADLVLDGDDDGPVNNLAVLTDVAPSYGPTGGALVAVSVVGVGPDTDRDLDVAVRRQLRAWYGGEVAGWERLAVVRVPWAQPRQLVADLVPLARDVRVGEHLWVCGDHRDTGSIQGALVSGRRAAEGVLAARG